MGAFFEDLEVAASAAVTDVFGGTARLMPQLRITYGEAMADPDRPAREIPGVFSDAPEEFGDRPAFEASAQEFWISALDGAQIPFEIKPGDRLDLSHGAGSARYTISAVQRAVAGDMTLTLSEIRDPWGAGHGV